MIVGLEKFKTYFKDYNDFFIIIGGTACSLLYDTAGLEFRTTKDIDIIITITKAKRAEAFLKQFYKFIKDGKYSVFQKDDKYYFYRFIKPQKEDFPELIELFSKEQLKMTELIERKYTSLDKNKNHHLSAIIIENDYYNLITKNIVNINDMSVANPLVLIFLKAIAWNDLKMKKENGKKNIDSKEIKKHRNDIVRINEILTSENKLYITPKLYDKVINILKKIEESFTDVDIRNIVGRKKINKNEIFRNIVSKFEINK